MAVTRFAQIFGIIYLLVGFLGFIPPLNANGQIPAPPAGAPALSVTAFAGTELGLFPINILHNIVHLAVGAIGLASARSFAAARGYARGLAIFYGLLAILGLIPATSTTFGLIPIFGLDVALHVVSALIAAYFGFLAPEPATFVDASRVRGRR